MELGIFSSERRKERALLVAGLFIFIVFELEKAMRRGPLSSLPGILSQYGINFSLYSLILPAWAAIGIFLKKVSGLQMLALFIWVVTLGFIFDLTAWGAALMPVGAETLRLALCIFSVGIAKRDLWDSFWLQTGPGKSGSFLRTRQWAVVILAAVPLALQLIFFWDSLRKIPVFPAMRVEAAHIEARPPGQIPIPFKYQVVLPPLAKLALVMPGSGTVAIRAESSTWFLYEKNNLQEGIQDMHGSMAWTKAFMRERYGMIPRVLKSVAVAKDPGDVFEVSFPGLWATAILKRTDKEASLEAFLWDASGQGLGQIMISERKRSTIGPELVTSLWRSEEDWSVAQYLKAARAAESSGQMDQAGLCLGYAAIVDKEDPERLSAVLDYFKRSGQLSLARGQLKVALELFPTDPNFLALKARRAFGEDPRKNAIQAPSKRR